MLIISAVNHKTRLYDGPQVIAFILSVFKIDRLIIELKGHTHADHTKLIILISLLRNKSGVRSNL